MKHSVVAAILAFVAATSALPTSPVSPAVGGAVEGGDLIDKRCSGLQCICPMHSCRRAENAISSAFNAVTDLWHGPRLHNTEGDHIVGERRDAGDLPVSKPPAQRAGLI